MRGMVAMRSFQDKVAFIWSVVDLLRGDYKASEYGRIILPLTVLRRLGCVLKKRFAATFSVEPIMTLFHAGSGFTVSNSAAKFMAADRDTA